MKPATSLAPSITRPLQIVCQAFIVATALVGLYLPNFIVAAAVLGCVLCLVTLYMLAASGSWPRLPSRILLTSGVLLLLCGWSFMADVLRDAASMDDARHSISWLINAGGLIVGAMAARTAGVTPRILAATTLAFFMFLLLVYCVGVILAEDPFFMQHRSQWTKTSLGNPNLFARTTLLAGAPLIALGVARSIRIWQSLLAWVPLCLLILLTGSRTNMVALLMCFVAIVPPARRTIRLIVAAAILAGVATTIALPIARSSALQAIGSVADAVVPIKMDANNERERVATMSLRARTWDASLHVVGQHPILGVGPSGERDAMRRLGSVKLKNDTVIVTHGAFLKAAVYSGLPAAILLLLAVACISWPAQHGAFGSLMQQSHRAYGRSLLIVLGVALFFQSLAADSTGYLVSWIWIGVVMATAIGSPRRVGLTAVALVEQVHVHE